MIPFRVAVIKIFLSTLLISGGAFAAFYVYNKLLDARVYDPRYELIAILQTGPQRQALKSSYLAELLHLSSDHGINLYQFDLRKGEEKLLSSPLIREATLKRFPPGTLYIDYEIRDPIGYIEDVENTAIDAFGVLFPFNPFYSPKKLPFIRLAEDVNALKWGRKIDEEKLVILNSLIKELLPLEMNVVRIDLSKTFDGTLSSSQIIVTLDEEGVNKRWNLVLSDEEWRDGLDRFLALKKNAKLPFFEKEIAVDLRLHSIATLRERKDG